MRCNKNCRKYSGASATDCGRLNVQATPEQSKAVADCAMQASQSKHPFYVAYDMPGMTVGVAGNAERQAVHRAVARKRPVSSTNQRRLPFATARCLQRPRHLLRPW